MLQLPQRLRLYLADALARDRGPPADFVYWHMTPQRARDLTTTRRCGPRSIKKKIQRARRFDSAGLLNQLSRNERNLRLRLDWMAAGWT
jgi:hypothetical protein